MQSEKHHRIPDMKLIDVPKKTRYSLEAYNTKQLKPVLLEHTDKLEILFSLIEKSLKSNACIILIRRVR